MQYLLMIYNNEAGMAAAPAEGVSKMNAAYAAYTEAMSKAGVVRGGNRLRPTAEATTVRVNGRQDRGARRALRRHQGATRRLLPDRRARPRCRDRMGGEVPGRLELARWKCGRSGRCKHDRTCGARSGRGRRAPQLRQARRVPVVAHARCRRRRGRAGGSVRRRARRLAGERHSDKSPRPGWSRSRAARPSMRRGAGAPPTKARIISP